MKAEEKINQTHQNLLAATNLTEPKKVPVNIDMGGWAYSYSGIDYESVVDDPQKCADAYCKFFDDVEIDTNLVSSCGTMCVRMYQAVGSRKYYFNEGGVAHNQAAEKYFGPEIYDDVIADPMSIAEKVIKKDCPSFSKPREEAYSDLKKALISYKAYNDTNMLISDRLTNINGIFQLQTDLNVYYMSEFSTIFDVYRGIKEALTDLRRRPEKVRAAVEALWHANNEMGMYSFDSEAIKEPFPLGHTMFHPECFLNDRWFDELYFDHFMKAIGPAMEAGKKIFLFGEGAFMRHLDRFNETPKGSMIILLDTDDPFEAKKIIGNNCTIMAGITLDLMCVGTKNQCVDYVKRSFDELAPGGGFIFSTNQEIVSAKDAKKDNLLAAYNEADKLSRK